MVIDFNDRESANIKSFAVKKKRNEINGGTTRFMSGKLLMLAKLFLKGLLMTCLKFLFSN